MILKRILDHIYMSVNLKDKTIVIQCSEITPIISLIVSCLNKYIHIILISEYMFVFWVTGDNPDVIGGNQRQLETIGEI